MATKTAMTLTSRSNADIINAIRTAPEFSYGERIPPATQGDITDSIKAITEFRPAMNEFLDVLINRIGLTIFKGKTWSNKLSGFKRGMLEYGDTIQELASGLITAHRYDPNREYLDVFKVNKPEVFQNFHTINRQDQYTLTVNEQMLRRAFTQSEGLATLVGQLMDAPYSSDNWDEYLIMRNLLVEYDRQDGFYRVQVPDAAAKTTVSERRDAAMQITEAVRAYAGKLQFISGLYNPMGVPTWSAPGELFLLCTPEFEAMLDVNVLSLAFNMSMADIPFHIITLDTLGIDGAQAVLTDSDFFLCADTLIETTSIFNPKSLSWNYFLHHHGVYSVSKFVNAIMFTTETGTVTTVPDIKTTGVTVDYFTDPCGGTKPTFAEKGETTRLTATVAGTVNPETDGYEVPQGVTWAITATDATPKLKAGTFIDAEGVLHVDAEETATYVTVTATSTYVDPTVAMGSQTYKSDTLNVGIGKVYTPGD